MKALLPQPGGFEGKEPDTGAAVWRIMNPGRRRGRESNTATGAERAMGCHCPAATLFQRYKAQLRRLQPGGFEGLGLLVGEIGLRPRHQQVSVECPDGPKLQIQVDAAPDSPSLGVLADKNLAPLDPEI